jgi:hypothetical protein
VHDRVFVGGFHEECFPGAPSCFIAASRRFATSVRVIRLDRFGNPMNANVAFGSDPFEARLLRDPFGFAPPIPRTLPNRSREEPLAVAPQDVKRQIVDAVLGAAHCPGDSGTQVRHISRSSALAGESSSWIARKPDSCIQAAWGGRLRD